MIKINRGKSKHVVMDYFIETEDTFECQVEIDLGVMSSGGEGQLCRSTIKKAANINKG